MAASVEGNLAWDGCKGRSKNGTRSFESGDDELYRTCGYKATRFCHVRTRHLRAVKFAFLLRQLSVNNILRVPSSFYLEPDNGYSFEQSGTSVHIGRLRRLKIGNSRFYKDNRHRKEDKQECWRLMVALYMADNNVFGVGQDRLRFRLSALTKGW